MLTLPFAAFGPAALVAILELDINGWLLGPEVRSTIAGLFAAIWSAIAAVFFSGLFGV
jgi:hypothetical protein